MRKPLFALAVVAGGAMMPGISTAPAVAASSPYGSRYDFCNAQVPPPSRGAPLVYDAARRCYVPSSQANRLP